MKMPSNEVFKIRLDGAALPRSNHMSRILQDESWVTQEGRHFRRSSYACLIKAQANQNDEALAMCNMCSVEILARVVCPAFCRSGLIRWWFRPRRQFRSLCPGSTLGSTRI